jgi:hypothetical protein
LLRGVAAAVLCQGRRRESAAEWTQMRVRTRGSIKISSRSWHYRVYRWWCNEYGYGYTPPGLRRDGSREDICHYRKVVVFWAPLTWFFSVPLYRWVRPWMVVLILAILGIEAWELYVNLWGALVFLLQILMAVLTLAVVIGAMFGVFYLREKRPGVFEPGITTLGLIGASIQAAKDRFCPYVELPEEWENRNGGHDD